SAFSGIYRNDGLDIFTLDTTITITDAIFSSLAWGDYDNDGDLDLVIIGSTPAARSVILQNVGGFSPNQPPQPPLGLNAETFLDSVIVSWLPSQDDSTFDAGICYNLRIGTSPGGEDIVSPMSNDNTGYRKVLNFGNANHNLSHTIKNLRPGTYYWAVQAIDHSFAGSQFSQEGVFEIREPYYQELAINLPGLSGGDLEWCDYDNDNDLDLFISGDSDSGAVVSLYNNGGFSSVTGWLFNEIPGVFPNLSSAASSWGDFDNDGDLDLVLQGHDGIDFQIELYRNEGNNIFIPENVNNLNGLAGGDLAWGDFDNDGDLDLIQAGHIDLVNMGNCYRNDGIDTSGIWQFTPMNADVRGFSSGCYDLGDFDNDRDLDILWTGFYAGAFATGVIRNDGVLDDTSWSFVEIVQFSGSGKARWGDYDSDGDLDILLAGNAPQGPKFSIYRNDGAIVGGGWLFSEIIIGAGNIQGNDACWGDYDSDGDLDILISGSSESSLMPVTNLFRNDQNDIFTQDIFGQFTPASSGRVSFVDFDNDGDLDIGLSGLASMLGVDYRILKIYQNEGGFTPNLPPASPMGLTTQTFVDSVIVSWQGVTDDLTPSTGLVYNLRMGRSPAAQDIMTPMSDLLSGYRKIVGLGNMNQNLNWTIKKLTPGNYYWSVQAIDNSFFGSAFSSETSFTIGIPPTIVHVPTDTQRVDSAVAVSALINTSSILVEANLNYKQGGSVNYLKIPMQISGNQYIGEIPPEAVTSRGLTYFIEAIDENGLISYTDTFSIRIKLEGNGITASDPQPAGSSQNSYRLISVPLDLENKILPAILEDDLGTYDKTKWRLFEPLPGGGFEEHPNVSPAMPGKAYWLIVAQENIFIDTGPGKTMNTVTLFSYQLYPGWNYFGIPFNFSVPMSAITLANNQDVDVRIYEGSWNVLSDSLHPFKGYAVYSEEATELHINPNLADSSGRNGSYRPKSTADYNWFIKISAYNQEATDLYNFVGVTAQASPQWDVYDLPEAPPMGDFISVAFPHPEWKRKCGDFATDIRGDFATGYKWEFSVRSNIGHQAMLILEKSENFPEDKYSCLIDVHSGTSLQIENSSLYTFSYSDNQSNRNFILLVGDSEFVQENQKSDRFLPTSFELFPNFPNPFNPTTKIRYAVPPPHNSGEPHHVQINIFNIGGQKVATLVDERKTAGYHEVNFDASRLASGVYICQFRSAG
ncbi:MAG: VCBS repeat-containing protein, partial [bacterium]